MNVVEVGWCAEDGCLHRSEPESGRRRCPIHEKDRPAVIVRHPPTVARYAALMRALQECRPDGPAREGGPIF